MAEPKGDRTRMIDSDADTVAVASRDEEACGMKHEQVSMIFRPTDD